MTTPVPEAVIAQAIDAAYEADLHFARTRTPDGSGWGSVSPRQARRLIEGAAPVIAAAERDRIYDQLGRDHYVIFTEDRWTVEHSVECRLSGRMPECEYHAAIVRIADEFDPGMAGRWRITGIDSDGLPDLERDPVPAVPTEGTTP